MNPHVFREYDIRGVADRDLPDAFVFDLGRAFVAELPGGAGADRPAIAVGRDCRLSSTRIRDALARGLAAAGADPVDIGVVPTPVLYFAAHHLPVGGAIMITGSHNPPADNGFKMLAGTAALHGDAIRALRERMETGALADAARPGRPREADALSPYLDHAERALRLGDRRGKVVVDAGNGAGGPAAVQLYRRLGFEVVELYCDMDGRFPNHHPDPTDPENLADLRARVAAERADVGLALDGDGDRLGAIDGDGHTLWGDQLMILFARAILRERPGATFIGEVKCSQALYDEIERAGGRAIMWKVGHSLIKEKIRDEGAALGGEMSGHLFFNDRYPGFDDAVYAGARLLEILSHERRPLAALRGELPEMVNTPELRVDCPDAIKFDVVRGTALRLRRRDDVVSVIDLDGARASFGDGWGLVRASNTQPALVVRCEAETERRLTQIRDAIESEIRAARADL